MVNDRRHCLSSRIWTGDQSVSQCPRRFTTPYQGRPDPQRHAAHHHHQHQHRTHFSSALSLSLTPAPSRRPKKLGAFSLSPRLDRRLISQKPHAGSVTAPEGSSVFLELELFSDSSPEALFRYSTYFRAAAPFRPAERVLMVIPTTAP